MFPRQMSAGGQNILMGERGSSANNSSAIHSANAAVGAFFDSMGQTSPMHTFSP